MRKLLALFVMLVVLGVCAQSYGFLVVYNVSCPVKGVDDTTAVTIPLKGYLVLNLDDVDGDLVDANLILYGKDSDKNKVYVVLNDSDSNDFLDISIQRQGEQVIVGIDAGGPFDFESLMLGKVKATNVGLADKQDIPGSLKGVIAVWDGILLDTGQDVTATGNISATNWSGATKYINKEGWTQDQTVTQLRTDLEDKGYEAVVLLP